MAADLLGVVAGDDDSRLDLGVDGMVYGGNEESVLISCLYLTTGSPKTKIVPSATGSGINCSINLT